MFDPDDSKAPKMSQKQIFITLQHALAMFHFELAHSPGADLVLADWLSRDGNKLNSIDKNGILVKKYTQSQLTAPNIHIIYKKSYINNEQKLQYLYTLSKMCHIRKNTHLNHNYPFKIRHMHIIQNFLYDKAKYDSNILSINNINIDSMDMHYACNYGYAIPYKYDMPNINNQIYANIKPHIANANNSTTNNVSSIPNYDVDEKLNRKSTRIKKQTVPFWEQKL